MRGANVHSASSRASASSRDVRAGGLTTRSLGHRRERKRGARGLLASAQRARGARGREHALGTSLVSCFSRRFSKNAVWTKSVWTKSVSTRVSAGTCTPRPSASRAARAASTAASAAARFDKSRSATFEERPYLSRVSTPECHAHERRRDAQCPGVPDFRFRLLPERRAAQRLARARAPAMDSNASRTASARSSSNVAGHHGCRVACASRPASNAAPKTPASGSSASAFSAFSAEARLKLAFSSKDAPARRGPPACPRRRTARPASGDAPRRGLVGRDRHPAARRTGGTLCAPRRAAPRATRGRWSGASWSRGARARQPRAEASGVRRRFIRGVPRRRRPENPRRLFPRRSRRSSSRTRASRMTAMSSAPRARAACASKEPEDIFGADAVSAASFVAARLVRRAARSRSCASTWSARAAWERFHGPSRRRRRRSAVRARRRRALEARLRPREPLVPRPLAFLAPRGVVVPSRVFQSRDRRRDEARNGRRGLLQCARRAFRLARFRAPFRSSSQRAPVVSANSAGSTDRSKTRTPRFASAEARNTSRSSRRLSSPASHRFWSRATTMPEARSASGARVSRRSPSSRSADGMSSEIFSGLTFLRGLPRPAFALETRALRLERDRFLLRRRVQVLDALRVGEFLWRRDARRRADASSSLRLEERSPNDPNDPGSVRSNGQTSVTRALGGGAGEPHQRRERALRARRERAQRERLQRLGRCCPCACLSAR